LPYELSSFSFLLLFYMFIKLLFRRIPLFEFLFIPAILPELLAMFYPFYTFY